MKRTVAVPKAIADDVAYARFRRLGDHVVLTNDAGRFHLMPQLEFQRMLGGELQLESPSHVRLAELGFLRSQPKIDVLADRLRDRRGYLMVGPSLHIMIITLRCDQICGYCHASRTNLDSQGYDMDEVTARAVVDRIFETTSPSITIEFQGGEPLVNWPILQLVVDYATQKNVTAGKALMFSLVTNLSLMTDEKAEYLLDHGVMICTSFDGPREVHEWNRHLARASSYDEAVKWIKEINARYIARGHDSGLAYVNALLTVTRATLSKPREVVDEYVALGLKAINLRPLNPFGFAARTWERIGYTGAEYLAFYREALDYIIELNRKGVEILEKKLALYLQKIFTDNDPNYMELRSPCGAGIGQMAYNYDGKIYTCDEGRMIGKMGDDLFEIGHAALNTHREAVGHETVRAMAAASYLDSVPGCSDCAYNPYCGVCPIYNYIEQGDLFGKMPGSDWCKISMGICDHLFGRLASEGPELRTLLERWTREKDRGEAYCVKAGSSMTY
ncbi:MAG: His-Xaa-Ser system radical SAM maturase HxsB [Myxococcales bacterium]|nr:His-Xaa-Ser system radical SAM maturase HxsB [Myxococcales bacterium]